MYYIAVLVLFFYERFIADAAKRRSLPFAIPRMEHPAYLISAVLAIVALFISRLATIYHAALDPLVPVWYRSAPLPIVADARIFWNDPYRLTATYGLAAFAALSCAALFVVHRALETRGTRRADTWLISGACTIMLICALFSPGLGSSDPYLYAGYAKLGLHAYGSQRLTLPCPDPGPNAWCKQPDFSGPSVYGPLFLSYLHALIGAPAPILHDIFMLRLTNIAWFALFIFLLVRLRLGAPIVAIAALNPLFAAQYVGDAHNDIICIDFALAGALALRRFPWITLLCCATASLVKLPFALLGALPFTELAFFPRLMWVTLTVALSVLASNLIAGRPYADAIRFQHMHVHGLAGTPAAMTFLVATFLIADRLLRRRTMLSGAYAIPALTITAAPYPWYAVWPLPYLLAEREMLTRFLIALPFTGFLVETPFQSPLIWLIFEITLMVAVLALEMVRRRFGVPLPADYAHLAEGEEGKYA